MCILAKELKVVGLINAQFAIKEAKIYVLEVNPRASRTVPSRTAAFESLWRRDGAHPSRRRLPR